MEEILRDQILLDEIKQRLPVLSEMVRTAEEKEEDLLYRFYHHSFKVYRVQELVKDIVDIFEDIRDSVVKKLPKPADNSSKYELERYQSYSNLNSRFLDIVTHGTGKKWDVSHNKEWEIHTLPIINAYQHSMYMLKMMYKYGRELDKATNCLPSGWASVLYLFNMR